MRRILAVIAGSRPTAWATLAISMSGSRASAMISVGHPRRAGEVDLRLEAVFEVLWLASSRRIRLSFRIGRRRLRARRRHPPRIGAGQGDLSSESWIVAASTEIGTVNLLLTLNRLAKRIPGSYVRGGVPKRPTGADCKSAGLCLRRFESYPLHHLCGCSSMVEPQPSKLMVWVRFPSPAPLLRRRGRVAVGTTDGYRSREPV